MATSAPDPPLRVGFVGLGRMGSRIAANLAGGGAALAVWNRTQATAETWAAEHGATAVPDLAALAERSDYVITMLADGEALIDVCSSGLVDGLDGSKVLVDMGTSGPGWFDQARRLVEAAGAAAVDAPVSGSVAAAESAGLLIMVGAPPELFERVSALLASAGSPVRVGDTGSATVLKLAVNSILYGINGALAEAVLLAEAAGVDPEVALDVVSRGAAGAPMIAYRRQQYLEPETAPVTFTLDLTAKDLRLALEAGQASELRMDQTRRTLATVDEVIADGFGGRDMGYLLQALRLRSRSG